MYDGSMVYLHSTVVVMTENDFVKDIDFFQRSEVIIQLKPDCFSDFFNLKKKLVPVVFKIQV